MNASRPQISLKVPWSVRNNVLNSILEKNLMVTEVDSGSHSIIFTLSAAIFCVLRAAQ